MAQACPFCESQKMLVEDHLGTVIISCQDCLAVGPVTAAQSQEQAWQRWNARHQEATEDQIDFELDDFV